MSSLEPNASFVVPQPVKVCICCGEIKPLASFPKYNSLPGKPRRSRCRACRNRAQKTKRGADA